MEIFFNALQLLVGSDNELRLIIKTTLILSFFSTAISGIIGVSVGTFLGCGNFRGKKLVMRIMHTLMSTPPVLGGLIVFMLLSKKGPLGGLGLLFSMHAMIIAQVLLITPIIAGMSASTVTARSSQILETTRGLGISKWQELKLIIIESRMQLVSIILLGFGRAIAEVGAVQLVGGNIKYRTRVMTTAIMLETNMGNFEFGIALGIILLIISFTVNSLAQTLQERSNKDTSEISIFGGGDMR